MDYKTEEEKNAGIEICDICNQKIGQGYHNYTCEIYVCDECYLTMSKTEKRSFHDDEIEYEYFGE